MARIRPRTIIVTYRAVYPFDGFDLEEELDALRRNGNAVVIRIEASDESFDAVAFEINEQDVMNQD